MEKKREYRLPFDKVDIIKQNIMPIIHGNEIVLQVNFENFSNVEIIEKTKGFFKKTKTYTLIINENYLTENLDIKEQNIIIEFEDKSILDDLILKMSEDYGKDILSIKNKTARNRIVFAEILNLLDAIENAIHKIPYNFEYDKQYIDYKIEQFETMEELILKIREKIPESKIINIEDFILEQEDGYKILRIKLMSNLPFKVDI